MFRKQITSLFAVALIFLALGCSGGSKDKKGDDRKRDDGKEPIKEPGKVVGKVRYDGQIVPVGTITFISKTGKAVIVDIEDGEYTAGKVPTGPVTVTVSTAHQRKVLNAFEKQRKAQGVDRPPGAEEFYKAREAAWAQISNLIDVPEKYANPETSGLAYTIERGKQTIDIDLPKVEPKKEKDKGRGR